MRLRDREREEEGEIRKQKERGELGMFVRMREK